MYINPVFCRDDGRWTFYDEEWEEFPNSWEDRELAEQALAQYNDAMQIGKPSGSLLLDAGV